MATNNSSNRWTWLLIVLGIVAVLLAATYFIFPELIKKAVGLLAGLFLVVTGMIFRRK
ncbi:MAG: hypothetical protein R3D58_06235 [Saprospiraceae bacterium]|jgi:uncharacterized membrane protein HdeD (DUF308 family)|nr:hypothetical protein [Lewinellaceae bacterium]